MGANTSGSSAGSARRPGCSTIGSGARAPATGAPLASGSDAPPRPGRSRPARPAARGTAAPTVAQRARPAAGPRAATRRSRAPAKAFVFEPCSGAARAARSPSAANAPLGSVAHAATGPRAVSSGAKIVRPRPGVTVSASARGSATASSTGCGLGSSSAAYGDSPKSRSSSRTASNTGGLLGQLRLDGRLDRGAAPRPGRCRGAAARPGAVAQRQLGRAEHHGRRRRLPPAPREAGGGEGRRLLLRHLRQRRPARPGPRDLRLAVGRRIDPGPGTARPG